MSFAPPVDHPELLPRLAATAPVRKKARRIDQVRSKIARFRTADDLAEARPLVARLVRSETARAGSRMLAYDAVGDAIGKSASWIRKLLGGHQVGLQRCEFLNIVHAYAALCAAIEAAAAAERLRAEQLKGEADAVVERVAGVVGRPPGPDRRPAAVPAPSGDGA